MDPKAEIPAISLKFLVTGLYRLYKDKKSVHKRRTSMQGEMGREGEREGKDKRME